MAHNLSLELLVLIIEKVTAHGDLYTCLFVNSSFYKAALPALWHSPKPHYYNKAAEVLYTNYSYIVDSHPDRLGLFAVPNVHHIRALSFGKIGRFTPPLRLFPLLLRTFLLTDLALTTVRVRDDDLSLVTWSCRHLQRITLHNLPDITGKSIMHLTQHSRRLTGVSLDACPSITAHSLLPLLETNRLTHFTLGAFTTFVRFAMSLDTNDLYSTAFLREWMALAKGDWVRRLSDFGIWYSIEDWVPFLTTHTFLESLTLKSCGVNKALLDAIGKHQPHLRRLDLTYSFGFSSRELRNFVRQSSSSQLSSVILTDCHLTDRADTKPVSLDRAAIERIRQQANVRSRSNSISDTPLQEITTALDRSLD
ncbi:hypothetical protein [Absidia glauca]|uniref:F-box domain-containing protein n=1 Tax=Absidia glauca TaxID=4829 RepID=A0A163JZV7_ABSGL|nr:hypothetical protein [Absidia glauca]